MSMCAVKAADEPNINTTPTNNSGIDKNSANCLNIHLLNVSPWRFPLISHYIDVISCYYLNKL